MFSLRRKSSQRILVPPQATFIVADGSIQVHPIGPHLSINASGLNSFQFGYSQLILPPSFFTAGLSRFLPWDTMMAGVGCQVHASPTAQP
jgi:hypothetical protein